MFCIGQCGKSGKKIDIINNKRKNGMARNVFYSFNYDDIDRVMVVRNRWVTKGNQVISGVIDHAEFEKVKKTGKAAVERWIDKQLEGTSVTVVLLGRETLSRPFVQYEIKKSVERGNAVIGVRINKIKNLEGNITDVGNGNTTIIVNGKEKQFSDIVYGIYDYIDDDGYNNLGEWVEKAAQMKGK